MTDKYNNIERNVCGRFGENAIDGGGDYLETAFSVGCLSVLSRIS